MTFAERVKHIQPSQTLAITALVESMRREGKHVIGLGAGEPDFDTPEPIKEAAIKAISDGFTKYTPISGLMDLKEAICRKYSEERNVQYSPAEVTVACGAKHSIANVLLALCQSGDEVIIPAPYWTSYIEQVRLTGAKPVVIDTDEYTSFKLSTSQLENAITPQTKVLMLNSPSNPTGVAYSKEELNALAEVLARHDFYIIFDEIYEKLIYDGLSHVSMTDYPDLRDRLILINGVSKTFSMTGWRIGYLLGPEALVKACNKIQSHTTSNPCSISQKASIAALEAGDTLLSDMLSAFDQRRRFLVDALDKMTGISCQMPMGAFYVFPNISGCFGTRHAGGTINSSMDFCQYMLERANVAMVPGEAFGSNRHVRLSYATSLDALHQAASLMREALGELQP